MLHQEEEDTRFYESCNPFVIAIIVCMFLSISLNMANECGTLFYMFCYIPASLLTISIIHNCTKSSKKFIFYKLLFFVLVVWSVINIRYINDECLDRNKVFNLMTIVYYILFSLFLFLTIVYAYVNVHIRDNYEEVSYEDISHL